MDPVAAGVPDTMTNALVGSAEGKGSGECPGDTAGVAEGEGAGEAATEADAHAGTEGDGLGRAEGGAFEEHAVSRTASAPKPKSIRRRRSMPDTVCTRRTRPYKEIEQSIPGKSW